MNRSYVVFAFALLALLVLFGCTQPAPPQPPGDSGLGAQDLLAQEASTVASDFSDADAQALENELLQDFGQ